jgi:hypothetical protein
VSVKRTSQRSIPGGRGDGGAFGEKTLAGLSAEFGVHPTISSWKQELVKREAELFARGSKAPAVEDAQKVIDDLHRKIGELQVERDFLPGQPAISELARWRRWLAFNFALRFSARIRAAATTHISLTRAASIGIARQIEVAHANRKPRRSAKYWLGWIIMR